jgi:hypothetical protein
MPKLKRKPAPKPDTTPAGWRWRKAGIIAVSAVTIGGATLALNPPAFNLESIRAYFAKHRGGGDNSIYGAEIGGSGELTDVFALTERLRKSGVGYDAFQAALDDDATGLNCARGQHPDLDSDNKWDPAKIQKVYSGTVNGSTFSPVYYCQMPTASAASGAGAREQLALQCAGRVQHDAAGFDHCRDFRDIAGSNALVTPFGPEATPAAPVATGGDGAGPGAEIHLGVDLQAKPGAPVKAVCPGRVVASSPEEHRVVLEHALSDGRLAYTEYGSLDQPAVKVGQAVAPGTVLGKLGADANSPAAPRLHYAEYLAVDSTADPATGPHSSTGRA